MNRQLSGGYARGLRATASGGGPRPSSASALLAKASKQLKGERVPRSEAEDDDGLGDYLNNLGRKSSKEIDWSKVGEFSDVSLSDKEEKPAKESAASKFLKKKPTKTFQEPTPSKSPLLQNMPKKSNVGRAGSLSSSVQKSAALSKAAVFTSKYSTNKTRDASIAKAQVFDSDLDDMSLSLDEDVLATVPENKRTFLKEKKPDSFVSKSLPMKHQTSSAANKSTSGGAGSYKAASTSVQSMRSVSDIISEDESSFGRGGSKFLKKKKPTQDEETKQPATASPASNMTKPVKKPPDLFHELPSAQRYANKPQYDTDEQSLADYIGGLSSTTATPRPSAKTTTAIRKPSTSAVTTPRTPTPHRHSPIQRQISEVHTVDEVSIEEEDDFKMNVMDIGALGVELGPVDNLISSSPPAAAASLQLKATDTAFIPEQLSSHIDTDYSASVSRQSSSKSKKKKKKEKDKKKEKAKKKDKQKPQKPDTSSTAGVGEAGNVFDMLGLQTVDDLLLNDLDLNAASDAEIMSEVTSEVTHTEIHTEIGDSYASKRTTNNNKQPLKSILSQTPRSARSDRGRVRLALDTMSSRSSSPEVVMTARGGAADDVYTDDFEESVMSEILTARSEVSRQQSQDASYSDDFTKDTDYSRYESDFTQYESDSQATTTSSNESYNDDSSTVTHTGSRSSGGYSSDTESYTGSTYSETDTDGTLTPPTRAHVPTTESSAQTEELNPLGLSFHWTQGGGYAGVKPTYGHDYVDPTPIATHTVSPDALEAMTSYSPGVFAINDMMRQQLELTKQFMSAQQHLHGQLIRSLEPANHRYTTLENTKQYIKSKRQKRLTYEEALRQVQQEMGLPVDDT